MAAAAVSTKCHVWSSIAHQGDQEFSTSHRQAPVWCREHNAETYDTTIIYDNDIEWTRGWLEQMCTTLEENEFIAWLNEEQTDEDSGFEETQQPSSSVEAKYDPVLESKYLTNDFPSVDLGNTSSTSCTPTHYNRGSKWNEDFSTDQESPVWHQFCSSHQLASAQVGFIQKIVCAALNSNKKLCLLFGVGEDQIVEGVTLSAADRDELAVAIDCCLTRGFIPPVNPDLVELRFKNVFQDGVQVDGCYIVELHIEVNELQYYQLNSGMVYFVINDRAEKISMQQARVRFAREIILRLEAKNAE